jgi:3-oxoacyl-[acyl-carrier-protein] synthase III
LFDEETMKAATDAALERAAVACESLGMTTSGIYERNHECASAIRALKDADTC